MWTNKKAKIELKLMGIDAEVMMPKKGLHCEDEEEYLKKRADEEHRSCGESSSGMYSSDADDDTSSSAEDKAPPPEAPPAPPVPVHVIAPYKKGIKSYDFAKTARAMCLGCSAKIDKGCFRLQYRTKDTKLFSDLRYLHVACLDKLPGEMKAENLAAVRTLSAQPEVSAEAKAQFDAAIAALS